MDLWIRLAAAVDLTHDRCLRITNQQEWAEAIDDPTVISSVLWPTNPLFPLAGRSYLHRRHEHEIDYHHDSERNRSFLEACRRLGERLQRELAGARVLVYAPLRGALPIWRCLAQFLDVIDAQAHFPVTSSFVRYPVDFGYRNRRGRPATGSHTHRLELQRLAPVLDAFDVFLYVDEIVSGGMMTGHLKIMLEMGLPERMPVIAAGVADRHGTRSTRKRARLTSLAERGRIRAFLWEGCDCLITEDQRYLLGIHYVDNDLGPNVVPMIGEDLGFFPEKRSFDDEVMAQAPPLPP